MLQNVLMMSLNTTFLLHMPMKGRGMNFSEKYFSPWLFVSSIFQRVMGSGRLGGRGGGGGGSKRHRIPHGATGKDSIQLSTTILFSEY